MSYNRIDRTPRPPMLADVMYIEQAGAVQNTWYTVGSPKQKIRILHIMLTCTVANETVEIDATINGKVLSGGLAATFGNSYYAYIVGDQTTPRIAIGSGVQMFGSVQSHFDCVNLTLLRIRKTTAAGASAIKCYMLYQQW